MLRIGIVEDEKASADILKAHLDRYQQEEGIAVEAVFYSDAVALLDGYSPKFDAIFFDVELPYMLGTEAAEKLREKDASAAIVFITNMAQYAVHGYAVDAIDYILKPVSYFRFVSMLKKLQSRLSMTQKEILIRTPNGMVRVPLGSIRFVEVEDHLLLYNTVEGIIESWDTLKSAEEKLGTDDFVKIGKSCIVGLKHIRSVHADAVSIGDRTFTISRRQKKLFWDALNAFAGR